MSTQSSYERQRLALAGVAEARLRNPLGYPRETRALLRVLERDESPRKAFAVGYGEDFAQPGVALVTDTRIIFVSRRSLLRKVVTFKRSDVGTTKIEDLRLGLVRLRIDAGEETHYFQTDVQHRGDVEQLRDSLATPRSSHGATSAPTGE